MNIKTALAVLSCCAIPLDPASAQSTPDAGLDGTVLVFAAASTTDAVEAIREEFSRLHPDVTVRASFAATSSLAQQIDAGAQADIFLSASVQWADFLEQSHRVARRRDLLGNTLVVIVPTDSKLKIDAPSDLTQKGIRHLALADSRSIPAGVYARQALVNLGIWDRLEPIVTGTANVQQALQYVAVGAAEAGIAYSSDAALNPRVRIALMLDGRPSEPIRYPLVLLETAKDNPAAGAFYDFLASKNAAAEFRRYGFIVLADAQDALPNAPLVHDAAPSRRWWWPTHDEWLALRLSFQVGVCAVVASLPVATLVGYLLARWQSRGKWMLELAVNLPLVLPPVVTGFLLLTLFAPDGPVGGALEKWFGVRIVLSWIGAAVAAAVVSFPLMVRAIRLSFQSVDPRLEMAARSLGAGRLDSFFSVTLPLARSGVLAGCVLAFARSLGEFGATIMLAGNIVGETQTVPLAIFSDWNRFGAGAAVWRLVGISILLAAAALVASEWLERRHVRRESA
jgi:molybdate transport system permease protein